jgi:hypothetical protein
MWSVSFASVLLALAVPLVLIFGYLNRQGNADDEAKGIGWQFIRYTVLSISIPVAGVLALNNVLTGEAAMIIGAAMGYAFGKSDSKSNPTKLTL